MFKRYEILAIGKILGTWKLKGNWEKKEWIERNRRLKLVTKNLKIIRKREIGSRTKNWDK